MERHVFAGRREKVRMLMRTADLDALLVTLDANRFYLSGFELHDPQVNESSGCLILMKDGRDWLCTDARFYDAAKRLWDEERIFIYRGKAMEQINDRFKDVFQGPLGFEARHLSVEGHRQLSDGIATQAADGLVEALRMIKEPREIEAIRRACDVNHQLMNWVPGVCAPGRSEHQIAWDIEQFFRNNGAEEMAFASIVAVNGNAALPHAEPGNDIVTDHCSILIDVGCRVDRYCSDQTRTFWVGYKPDSLFNADLDLTRQAQAKAIAAIAPGRTGAEIYAVAKDFFDSHGVGDLFTHSLGHGVGLQTHEGPSLSPASTSVLKPGMVVTVEPGLYRPGTHGVRWEHMVLVTEDGPKVL